MLWRKVCRSIWSAADWILGFIFGRDIFISYSRKDPRKYVEALVIAVGEKKPRLSFYLDRWSASSESDTPQSLYRNIRWCQMTVVVCTRNSMASKFVKRELRVFGKSGRKVIPIDIDHAFYTLQRDERLWKKIGGEAPEPESEFALLNGVPSTAVVDRIVKAATFTKQQFPACSSRRSGDGPQYARVS